MGSVGYESVVLMLQSCVNVLLFDPVTADRLVRRSRLVSQGLGLEEVGL